MTKEAIRKAVFEAIKARTLGTRELDPKAASVEKALSVLPDYSGVRDAVAGAMSAVLGVKIMPTTTGWRPGVAFIINKECKDTYPGGTMKGQVYVAIGDNVAKSRREGGREWSGLPKFGGTQHVVPTEDEIKGYVDNAADDVLAYFLMTLAD